MGYSPFGFDDIGRPFSAVQGFLFGADVTDPALKTPQSFEEYAALGHALREMLPMLASAYGTRRLQAVSGETEPTVPSEDGNPFGAVPASMDFGAFRLLVTFRSPFLPRSDGACLCLAVSDTECWIAGNACQVTFASGKDSEPNLDLLLLEEGTFEDGKWVPGRRLNGDESARPAMDKPSVWHARFFTYP